MKKGRKSKKELNEFNTRMNHAISKLKKDGLTQEQILSITGFNTIIGFRQCCERMFGEKPYFIKEREVYSLNIRRNEAQSITEKLSSHAIGCARQYRKLSTKYNLSLLDTDPTLKQIRTLLYGT